MNSNEQRSAKLNACKIDPAPSDRSLGLGLGCQLRPCLSHSDIVLPGCSLCVDPVLVHCGSSLTSRPPVTPVLPVLCTLQIKQSDPLMRRRVIVCYQC